MERPKFLDLDEKTRATWRSDPITGAMLEWIAWEADRCNYSASALLRKGQEKQATAIAGKAEAMEEILMIVHRKDPEPEPKDEPFMDPVFRFNPELAPAK